MVHTVVGTAANVNDVTQAGALLHGQEEVAVADAGYQGVHNRSVAAGPAWYVAMRPGLRRKLNPLIEPEFIAERLENAKASVQAKVEHPFRVVKSQFGYAMVRYRGLAKNTARLTILFALSNLWMVRRQVRSPRITTRQASARSHRVCKARFYRLSLSVLPRCRVRTKVMHSFRVSSSSSAMPRRASMAGHEHGTTVDAGGAEQSVGGATASALSPGCVRRQCDPNARRGPSH